MEPGFVVLGQHRIGKTVYHNHFVFSFSVGENFAIIIEMTFKGCNRLCLLSVKALGWGAGGGVGGGVSDCETN